MTVIGEIPLKRSLSSSEAVRMSCNPISRVLIRRGNLGTQKDTSIHRREKKTWRHREKMAIYKPRKEASEETSAVVSLNLNF